MEPIEAAADIADAGPTAENVLASAQGDARLHGCLESLARHEQSALRGAFFDGNTYEDLAERRKVPLGTMKSWIRRAMIKLKACLEQ
jgi:DNA-directed RNA polymerase specialized sigma24 family protein